MLDATGFAASQYVLYGCLVPGGVAASEGFDGGGSLSFRGCYVSDNAGSSLCGDVEYNARSSGRSCPCEGAGRV